MCVSVLVTVANPLTVELGDRGGAPVDDELALEVVLLVGILLSDRDFEFDGDAV